MKKQLLFFILLIIGANVYSQEKQEIRNPSEGKSLVYIIRTGAGPLISFKFYDKDNYLGVISGTQYIVYECEPGEHLFWTTSENRDFIEANLEANKVYVVIAEGKMGAFIARINFEPLDPSNIKHKKLFYRVIKNDKPVIYSADAIKDEDKSKNIEKGLAKYESIKDSDKIKKLTVDMNVENADKP